MPIIYKPKGKAAEYAPLAVNIYTGCSSQCTYCFAPNILRAIDHSKPYPRKNIIKQIEREAPRLAANGCTDRILFSFMSDPYQPLESELGLTRAALRILGANGLKSNVLTKHGPRAERDFDLFKKYDTHLGQTIVFADDIYRQQYELNAATIPERLATLARAHEAGITTWVSIEPVIDTTEALKVVDLILPYVNYLKVGKINHNKRLEAQDWQAFVDELMPRLISSGVQYYIKKSLQPYLRGRAVETRS